MSFSKDWIRIEVASDSYIGLTFDVKRKRLMLHTLFRERITWHTLFSAQKQTSMKTLVSVAE